MSNRFYCRRSSVALDIGICSVYHGCSACEHLVIGYSFSRFLCFAIIELISLMIAKRAAPDREATEANIVHCIPQK